jgi:hypothetical protein
VSVPVIFIATNRLKPGKLNSAKKRLPDLIDFIQANEPRLIAFNEYANEEGRLKFHARTRIPQQPSPCQRIRARHRKRKAGVRPDGHDERRIQNASCRVSGEDELSVMVRDQLCGTTSPCPVAP